MGGLPKCLQSDEKLFSNPNFSFNSLVKTNSRNWGKRSQEIIPHEPNTPKNFPFSAQIVGAGPGIRKPHTHKDKHLRNVRVLRPV